MIDFPLVNRIIVASINIIAVWLAVLVSRHHRHAALNKIFLLMVPMMLLWVDFAYFARLVDPDHFEWAALLLKIAWFVTPLVFVLLYLFVINLVKKVRAYWWITVIVIVIGLSMSFIVSFTAFIIETVTFTQGDLVIVYGPAMLFFLVNIAFIMAATLVPLVKGYHVSRGAQRDSIQYLTVGIVVFYLANLIFNIALPIFAGVGRFYYLGDYSLIVLLIMTSLAVIKEHLLGVRVFVTQLLVTVISALLVYNVLLADSLLAYIWQSLIFVAFVGLGFLLVKSSRKEIAYAQKLKEQLRYIEKQNKQIHRQAEILKEQSVKLKRANEKLKILDNLKTEFLSITSHQLRTPLTGIKGYLSMMMDGDFGKFSKEQQKVLEQVTGEVDRLRRLVQVFLNVSRIESGRLKIEKISFDVVVLIQEVVKELAPAAEKKGLELVFEPLVPRLEIRADRDKLKDVLVNLVDNAIKYTHKGRVWIELRHHRRRVAVEVHDTGVGIDPEEAEKLFKKFSRGKGIAQISSSGAGLGLFIAKKIVEAHHGEISGKSKGKGMGSIFSFSLPFEAISEEKLKKGDDKKEKGVI